MSNPSKAKGSKFEVAVAEYLDSRLPMKVERRALRGSRDTGDISGIPEVVIEVKCHKAMDLGSWVSEAEIEADRDGGSLPICIHKRRGRGHPADSYATMPVWALTCLLLEYFPELDPNPIRERPAAPSIGPGA